MLEGRRDEVDVRRDRSICRSDDWSRSIPHLTNKIAAALPDLWPKLRRLVVDGEHRQRLQAIDIRYDEGMMDTGKWYVATNTPTNNIR